MPIGAYEKKVEAMVRLTPTQQAELNRISAELQCIAGGGPKVGQPSWRVMLLGIADGALKVYNPKAKKEERALNPDRKAKKKSKRQKIPGAPDWWRPLYGNAMGQEYALKKSSLGIDEISALGLRFERNELLSHPDLIVGKPEWAQVFRGIAARPEWWWVPAADSSMESASAVAASGYSIEQLIAGGLIHDVDLGIILAPDDWAAWHPTEATTQPSAPVILPTTDEIAATVAEANELEEFQANLMGQVTGKPTTGPRYSAWDFEANV